MEIKKDSILTRVDNKMEKFELKAIYDNRKQFYGKANVLKDKDIMILKSYNTNILEYNTKTKELKFLTNNKNHFTMTTNRHINEFLQQFTNENAKSKQELLKLANII